ncbi:MAG: DNA primase [Candidatus Omnitrophica bacterium]|nr:DNA primase [Candidatus Omnitrophota bacterium]
MRYDQTIIDDVQQANDIVEIIGQYLPLKKAGRNFKALCPFHQEKTPSFMIHPEKQIFHCFGCQAGGNVFTFLMRYENVTFPEALRQLAEKAHIRLPEIQQEKGGEQSESERLYEVYECACNFYHEQLKDSVKGKLAREYYLGRSFKPELAHEFKLGWASEDWRALFEFLSRKGFKEPLLLKSGLIQRSAKGHCYDNFRGRIMFPVHNLRGKVVAFGGRVLKGDGPKYLNSSENPIFQKRRELFGLHVAKRFIDRDKPQVLVVEGYFDFLRLYQEGFKASVATLGTALTENHVQLLKRFADEAIVVYDGDKAGEAAALRGLEVFLEEGMSVKLIRMPEGMDPDDFLREKGQKAFQELVQEALDFFDYKMEILFGRFNRRESLGLIKITNEFLDTLVKVQNPVLLDRYLKRLAASLGVEEYSLRTELAKLRKKHEAGEKRSRPRPSKTESAVLENMDEILLLGLAIDDPAILEKSLQEIQEMDLQSQVGREMFSHLIEIMRSGHQPSWPQILNRIDDERVQSKLVEVSSFQWGPGDRLKAFEDCLKRIRKKQLDGRLVELRRHIARAEKKGNQTEVGQLTKEYQELLRQHH